MKASEFSKLFERLCLAYGKNQTSMSTREPFYHDAFYSLDFDVGKKVVNYIIRTQSAFPPISTCYDIANSYREKKEEDVCQGYSFDGKSYYCVDGLIPLYDKDSQGFVVICQCKLGEKHRESNPDTPILSEELAYRLKLDNSYISHSEENTSPNDQLKAKMYVKMLRESMRISEEDESNTFSFVG